MDDAMDYVEGDRWAAFGSPATPQASYSGHRYGDITLRDRASAHIGDAYTNYHIFGDSYTNYHISHDSQPARSTEIPPLSISACIAGIQTASAHITGLIDRILAPSETLEAIKWEVLSLGIILKGLQRFVERTSEVLEGRTVLIGLEDVVALMSQLVLVYSDLKFISTSWSGPSRAPLLRGPSSITKTKRVLSQLQRYKLSLSLVLQIVQW